MITVNGEKREFSHETTLKELVENEGYNPLQVAAEVNLKVASCEDFNGITIKDGDEIEIVTFMGGG